MLVVGAIGCFLPTVTDWFALNDIVHYVFYLILGMVCAKWCKFIEAKWMIVGIFSLVASVALFVLLPHNKIVSFIISLFMLLAIWIFALILNEKCKVDRNAVYTHTYSIFILSWPCQLVVEILLERFLKQSFEVVFPAMLITGLTIPLVIILVIDFFEKKTKTTVISKMIGR